MMVLAALSGTVNWPFLVLFCSEGVEKRSLQVLSNSYSTLKTSYYKDKALERGNLILQDDNTSGL